MASFNFGPPAGGSSNTPNKPLFGSNTSASTTPSVFGSAGNKPNPGSSTAGTSGLFGANAGSTTLFGAAPSSTQSSTLFGGSSTPAGKPGGLFGGGQAGSGASQPSSTPQSFGNFGAKSADTSGTTQASMFGSGAPGGGSTGLSFGTANSSGASTPAAIKTVGTNSTTPAGPPPGGSLFGPQAGQQGAGPQQTSSLFGQKPASSSSGPTQGLLFGGKPAQSPANPLGAAPGSGFTGFLNNKDASADKDKPAMTQQPTASGLNFPGGARPSSTAGMQNAQGTPQSSLFGLGGTTLANKPTPSPLSFGALPGATQSAQPQPSMSGTPSNPLGGQGGQDANKPPVSTPAPTSNLFNMGSSASAAPGGSAPFSFNRPGATPASTSGQPGSSATPAGSAAPASTQGASTGLFSSIGNNMSTAAPGATTTTAPPTTTSAPASNIFNLGGNSASATPGAAPAAATGRPIFSTGTGTTQPAATSAQTSATATSAAPASSANTLGGATTTNTAADTTTNLAGSTAGPTPSNQSRLKNKTMDEIITRWAADLSKYQKEFQSQAEQVALWDRALVENSDTVKQLYSKTFQAERDASEVERQLRIMEENQQELESYLDKYEKQVEDQLKVSGVIGQGRSDGLRGPDQDRERTYKLAEKLQDRLNELNKDLTEMIEEINTTSQTLSKTGKSDDPLTKVVRVLNSQLSQLQQIETGTSQLQARVTAAQKEGQRVGANGWNGLGTDPTEDFYRSFRGGRSDRFGGVS